MQISNLHSLHLLPICCCLGGAFLSPTDATWPDQVNPLTWTNLSTPIPSLGQPQDAAQHVVGSNAYKDTKGDGVPRIFQVDLQEMKMRIMDTQQSCFVKEYMLQLSSRSLGSSLLEPSGPEQLLPLCPCCRLPHRPLKPKSSKFRSLSFLQIMQIITKEGAVNFWTLSET